MKNTIEPPSHQGHPDLSPKGGRVIQGEYGNVRKYLVSLWNALWLLALTIYIMAGVASVPFHGDEAMQITMSRDYFTAFVNHQPQTLLVMPPYPVDSPNLLRLINGSINLYGVGFSLQAAGYGERDLPSLWEWPLSYDENVARGNRPEQTILVISRVSSALFLAMSTAVLFGIGWQLRGRLVAYVASGLYALNPVVLLNGRRAMMEGSVLFFGLLTILLAVLICKGRNGRRWWLTLGIVGGLTLASKHSGIVYVAAALGWVVIRQIQMRIVPPSRQNQSRDFYHKDTQQHRGITTVPQMVRVGISVVIMVMVFIALSPAQWNNPVARLGDLVIERAKLLESQVQAEPNAPTSIGERAAGIVTQPYLQALVYFEAAFWPNAKSIQTEIAAYDTSVWSGLHAGAVVGGVLTVLAALGIITASRAWQTWEIGILVWLAVTSASLLVNPLPWQRYYLALYPLATLLAAMSIGSLKWWNQRRSST